MKSIEKYLFISVSFFALLSPTFAMEPDEDEQGKKSSSSPRSGRDLPLIPVVSSNSDDDWDTSPDPSFTGPDSKEVISFSKEEQEELKAKLVDTFKGPSPSEKSPPKVGKISIPSGLLGVGFGKQGHIVIPLAPPELLEKVDHELYKNHDRLLEEAPSSPLSEETPLRDDTPAPLSPNTPFEERIQSPVYQESLFKALDIEVNEDNIASYFFTEENLRERLMHNFHGPHLVLNKGSFHLNPKSFLIFDALVHAKSIKRLSFVEARFNLANFFSLTNALMHNRFIQHIDFTRAGLTEDNFTLLGLSLKEQRTLREMILKSNFPLTEDHVHGFYQSIKGNIGLRFIEWPEAVTRSRGGFLSPLKTPEIPTLNVLQDIAAYNPVACFHLGTMFLRENKEEPALEYFLKAHKLGHPFVSYEIAKMKERGLNIDEARTWYEQAADKGFPRALVKMGDYYNALWPKGNQNEPNLQKAVSYYTQAKDLEHPKAFYRLATLAEDQFHALARQFKRLTDIPDSRLREARAHFDQAAYLHYQAIERGYPDAFVSLGLLYDYPNYSGAYNPQSARYYIEWAKRFKKVKGTVNRLLSTRDLKKE